MAKTKQQKEDSVVKLSEDFGKSKSVIFVNHSGLKVSQFEELRKKCRELNVGCKVIKKTLLQNWLKQSDLKGEFDPSAIDAGVVLLLGFEDEVSPAKIAKDFSKTHEQFQFYGGVMTANDLENNFISKESTIQLSMLPSKQELYAKVVGSIKAPVSGFLNVLSGNLRGFITALKAIQDQKS